jgi:rod shape-determining protein MreD
MQSTLLYNFSIFGVAPNLILILTIVFTFLFSEKHGIIFGILFGLLSDLCFSQVIGTSALSYFLVALLVENLKSYLYRDNKISVIFIALIGTIAYNLIFWGVSTIFGANLSALYMLAKQPISILYNSLIIFPIYWFLVRKVIGYRGFKYM